MRHVPWTEQSLYFTLLESTLQFDRFHIRGGEDAIYDGPNSLWEPEQLAWWDPERAFRSRGDARFLVVQSNTGIDVATVREKLMPYLLGE